MPDELYNLLREGKDAEFYDKTKRIVKSYISRRIANLQDQEDCLQEAYSRFLAAKDSILEKADEEKKRNDRNGFVMSCLSTKKHDSCVDLWRKKKHGTLESLPDMDNLASAPEEDSPVCRAIRAEESARLWEALAKLSPEHRQIILLRDFEGLSYEEIAKRLQISVGSAKLRHLRAIRTLRELLGGRR